MGITTDAGLLKDGKITPEALAPILRGHAKIQEVGGEKGLLFPCGGGAQIKPVPPELRLPSDIADKEKYPEYHTEVIGRYESILKALDIDGNFSLPPPFIDPVALGVALNGKPPDFNFSLETMMTLATNPGLIAAKLEIDPIELVKKLIPNVEGSLIKPPVPNFSLPPYGTPEYFANLKNISLPIPAPNFSIAYPDKIEAELWKNPQLGVVMVLMKVVQKLIQEPTLVLDLLSVPPKPCFIIDAVGESKIFGSSDSGEVGKSSTDQHLITWTGSLLGGVAIGLLPGNGGKNGAVGNYFRAVEIVDQEGPVEVSSDKRLPAKRTRMTKEEIAKYLHGALMKIDEYKNKTPPQKTNSLNVALSHACLETGNGRYMFNYNFAHAKAPDITPNGWTGYYTYFATPEYMGSSGVEHYKLIHKQQGVLKRDPPLGPNGKDDPMAQSYYDDTFTKQEKAEKLNMGGSEAIKVRKTPPGTDRDAHPTPFFFPHDYKNDNGKTTYSVWFYPPSPGCRWQAFTTPEEGASAWLETLKRSFKAQYNAVLAGNIDQYAQAVVSSNYSTLGGNQLEKYAKDLKGIAGSFKISEKIVKENP